MFRRLSPPAKLARGWRPPLSYRQRQRPRYATASNNNPASQISRIESRLPRFLQRIVTPLRNAPVSHITAFLILHELTAIIPLFGLAAVFHYANWLPPYISEGQWVKEGTERFGRYLRRKGWISPSDEQVSRGGKWWGRGEGGVRIVVELATAYAITKALLPLRLIASVWATPWFAQWTVLPLTNRLRRIFTRGKGGKAAAAASSAAGTGAVEAGAVPKGKGG